MCQMIQKSRTQSEDAVFRLNRREKILIVYDTNNKEGYVNNNIHSTSFQYFYFLKNNLNHSVEKKKK